MSQWNKHAQAYKQGFLTRTHVLWPNISNLVSYWAGQRLLDIGCGNGEYAAHFVQNGARRVVGIDSSSEQIAIAQKTFAGLEEVYGQRLQYVHSSLQDFEYDGTFDVLLANMVLCNVPNLQQMDLFLQAITRHSHAGSRFCFSNVAEAYQRSGSWVGIIHNYPDQKVPGVAFQVTLFRADGSFIGPFTNYYWPFELLKELLEHYGWQLEGIGQLTPVALPNHPLPSGEWAIYELYTFRRQ